VTPFVVPDLDPIASALARPLADAYSLALVRKFVGGTDSEGVAIGTTEDFLPLRRLVEAGWTLARMLEAIEGAVDGVGTEALRDVVNVAEGRE
jgi:hypothetical protein